MPVEYLTFSGGDPRIRALNQKPVRQGGEYVLYFCQMFRRGRDNAALDYAILRANELGIPCVVYEAVKPNYPFASDRFHTFLLEGARETANRLKARGVAHVFFLPRTPEEARGVLGKVSARAALVVSDDYPAFVAPAHNAAAAPQASCAYHVVDDCAVVPMNLFPKEEIGARTLRPKFHKIKEPWLRPLSEVGAKKPPPSHLDLPFDPVDWGKADVRALVAGCAIDHAVPPVPEFPGGSAAAEKRLEGFLRHKFSGYLEDRNEPSRDATSHLSPYLHFGMISARHIALRTAEWAEAHGSSDAAAAFLEQLLIRRGLAYNFARRCPAPTAFTCIPNWAKATLAEHEADPRPYIVSLPDLEAARSPDEVWNTAQLELRVRGVIHNYARMLWGKLVIPWTARPQDAFEALIYLNDKYALDGRDPDGYASIAWCFGLHDRPWPSHPCFGKVRTMTSRSARSKLDLDDYLGQAREWRSQLP